MASWPNVRELVGAPPAPVLQHIEEGLVLARAPEVVAWGDVEGVPWQIQAFVTAPAPGARWWEHGPVGPELEFLLGREGGFGGGGASARLNEGTHLTASIGFFGAFPLIVSWLGVVSDTVTRLEVRLDDGDLRILDLRDGPAGFPRLFWFFPPRPATGEIVALAADGRTLQRERLVDAEVHPLGNAGTSVNPLGYPEGTPPPGWPDDPGEYGPGEGPRHAEDFHLHESSFPLYVVPPDRWEGYAGLAGSRRSATTLDRVAFGYFDEPGGGRRGFEVVNERPGRSRRIERAARPEDVGIWWSDPFTDDVVANFAGRFLSSEERRAFRGSRGWFEAGLTRIVGVTDLVVADHRTPAVFRDFRSLPSLRSITFELPGVRMKLLAWDLGFDELEAQASALERLLLGTALFHAMQAAQVRSDRRFGELHGHGHGPETAPG